MIYAYIRVSTKGQRIDRQYEEIKIGRASCRERV